MSNFVITGQNVVAAAAIGATAEDALLPAANLAGPLYRPYRSGPFVGFVDLVVHFPMDEPERVGFVGLLDHTLQADDTVTGFAYGPAIWHGDRFTRADELEYHGEGWINVTPTSVGFERWTGTIQPPTGVGLVSAAVWFEIWDQTPYTGGIVGAMVDPPGNGHQRGFVLNGDGGLVLNDFTGTLIQFTWRPRVATLAETAAGPFDVGGGRLTSKGRRRLPRHLFFTFPPALVEAVWLRVTAAASFDVGGLHVAGAWAGEGRDKATVTPVNPNRYKTSRAGLRQRVGAARRHLREVSFELSPTDLGAVLELQQLADLGDGPVCVGVFEDREPAMQRYGWFVGHLSADGADEGDLPGWSGRRVRIRETTGGAR